MHAKEQSALLARAPRRQKESEEKGILKELQLHSPTKTLEKPHLLKNKLKISQKADLLEEKNEAKLSQKANLHNSPQNITWTANRAGLRLKGDIAFLLVLPGHRDLAGFTPQHARTRSGYLQTTWLGGPSDTLLGNQNIWEMLGAHMI